jgi:hypothetical protein
MLLQGEFYLASSDQEQYDTIQEFLESSCETIVVVDPNLTDNIIKYIETQPYTLTIDVEDAEPVLYVSEDSEDSQPQKTVYIRRNFDQAAKDLVRSKWGIVAFF